MKPLATRNIIKHAAIIILLAYSTPMIANNHHYKTLFEVTDNLLMQDNVIILDPTRSSGTSMAEPFAGLVYSEAMESGVRLFFNIDSIESPLKSAEHDDIVVGADPHCQYFPVNCGLMGRLIDDPEEVPCHDGIKCLKFEFSHVGLDSVIKMGTVRIQTNIPIRSDDRCFTDRLSTNITDGASLESASTELECANWQQGPLPSMSSVAPVASASRRTTMLHVAGVSQPTSFCDEEGDWSRELDTGVSKLQLLDGTIEFDTEYRAVLVLTQTLQFDSSGVDGDVSVALCQLGEAGVRLAGPVPKISTPLWVRGSGPHFIQLGWLPLVYSTTARLDLGLSGEASVQISPFVTFNSEEHHEVNFSDSVSEDGGRKSSRFHITPGELSNANAEIEATASLMPALQVNLYGVAGPFAAGEMKLDGISRLAGSGHIAVGAQLSSTLTTGVSERVTGRRWSHSWRLSHCGVGNLPHRPASPCRDGSEPEGVQQALFRR